VRVTYSCGKILTVNGKVLVEKSSPVMEREEDFILFFYEKENKLDAPCTHILGFAAVINTCSDIYFNLNGQI
jgi:hypothetical protein